MRREILILLVLGCGQAAGQARILIAVHSETGRTAALAEAVRHARRRRIGVGKAVSELVLRAVQLPVPTKRVDGVLVFDPPGELPEVTDAAIRRIPEEDAG